MFPRRAMFAVLMLALGALAPALATTQSCFHYTVRMCSGGNCCTSNCTECDYYGPNGEDQGYIVWCTDGFCQPE
jgi:hypothetical protein